MYVVEGKISFRHSQIKNVFFFDFKLLLFSIKLTIMGGFCIISAAGHRCPFPICDGNCHNASRSSKYSHLSWCRWNLELEAAAATAAPQKGAIEARCSCLANGSAGAMMCAGSSYNCSYGQAAGPRRSAPMGAS
eukprot:COSAG05_NODE_2194_length_3418_cov_6.232901_2_plen_134_part_00